MGSWLYGIIQGLSSAEYHFLTLVLFLAVVFSVYQAYKLHQRSRFIKDTATSKIASAAQGYVELSGIGELIADSNIVSPFSQRRCLWYQCKVEVKQSTGNRSHWVEESNEISDQLFMLHDDSGECVVIPDGAQVVASEKHVWHGSSTQERYKTQHRRAGFSRFIGLGNYRFTEKLILVADPLYVIGQFESVLKTINPQTVQQQADDLIRYWKTNPIRFLRPFDKDNNGKIQKNEWKLIRQHAKAQVMQQHQHPVVHTISKPKEKNHPFLLSTKSEYELLNKNRIYIFLYLMLFFGLLYILLITIRYPQ